MRNDKSLGADDFDKVTKLVPDVQKFGNPDTFQLLCKAWSEEQSWMKSTKVLDVPGAGVFLQVTTQQGDNVAESVCWAPNVHLVEDKETGYRSLVKAKSELEKMMEKNLPEEDHSNLNGAAAIVAAVNRHKASAAAADIKEDNDIK